MGSIKSRPIYRTLRIDPAGRAHLIVTDLPAFPEAAIEAAPAASNIARWLVATSAPGIAIETVADAKAFRATADLLLHLSYRLAREPVGLRLYALGTEAFLWDVMNLAKTVGLGGEEVFLHHVGSARRRVYCTHCKSMNEDVATNIVPCRACGAQLFVRDHFSRRLAAFMGVMVDAEIPGEIPQTETLYP